MKLQYITIMVQNIEKSLAFYQELAGLKIARRFNPENCEIAFLENESGETMIELVQLDGVKADVKGSVISFSAGGSLETVFEKSKALGYTPGEICDKGPKLKYFHVTDPNGVTVEFTV